LATESLDLGTSVPDASNQGPAQPSTSWRVINLWLVFGLVAILAFYWDILRWLWRTWSDNADYSHGYFVPLFVAYLLWSSRGALKGRGPKNVWELVVGASVDGDQGASDEATPTAKGRGATAGSSATDRATEQTAESVAGGGSGGLAARLEGNSGLALGIALLVGALLLRMVGIYVRITTLEAMSLIPFLLGGLVIVLGWPAFRWAGPTLLFLLFMIPLPYNLSGALSGVLQSIATQVSTFSLQTLGVPAFAEGNIITLTNGQIGVAEACSGLRMLYAFFALTVGACMVIDRAWYEKVLIASTAVPIAILANCVRIVVTGLAFEHFSPEIASRVFHDAAGWLMMPLGFALLMVVLAILDRLIVPEERFPLSPALR